MFAMLNGAWPRVTSDGADLAALERAVPADAAAIAAAVDQIVAEAVAAQVEAGMGLVTDGNVRWADPQETVMAAVVAQQTGETGPLVTAWKATAALTDAAVAQLVPGPFTLGRKVMGQAIAKTLAAGEEPPSDEKQDESRTNVTLAIADALADEIGALAAAGCPMIVVEEPDAVHIGDDAASRALFVAAGTRLLGQADGIHAMLAINGGSADGAGAETIFGPPWQSLLVDLIEGPDNWKLVRATPGDRGIVCAALTVDEDAMEVDQTPQLVWAAHYAASGNSRGFERIGLANSSPLTHHAPVIARAALGQLAAATRYATMSPTEAVEAGLDPRTIAGSRVPPAQLANRAARRHPKPETIIPKSPRSPK